MKKQFLLLVLAAVVVFAACGPMRPIRASEFGMQRTELHMWDIYVLGSTVADEGGEKEYLSACGVVFPAECEASHWAVLDAVLETTLSSSQQKMATVNKQGKPVSSTATAWCCIWGKVTKAE